MQNKPDFAKSRSNPVTPKQCETPKDDAKCKVNDETSHKQIEPEISLWQQFKNVFERKKYKVLTGAIPMLPCAKYENSGTITPHSVQRLSSGDDMVIYFDHDTPYLTPPLDSNLESYL